MERSAPVDGFSLAYERFGAAGPTATAVLLHGWPGDRHDWRDVVPLIARDLDVITCDLRGFGESDKHLRDPADAYSAVAQARSVLGLIAELGVEPVVLAGYDIGSRVAQTIARTAPSAVRTLVVAPPLPGPGRRVLDPEAQREFWYQPFHQLDLSAVLLDGSVPRVRNYLEHFWTHWSGPSFEPDPAELDRLAASYGQPGAFTASIGWYRAGSGTVATALTETPPDPAERIQTPTTVLWPAHDPLFPTAWSGRLDAYFADLTVSRLDTAGHFSPLEAPTAWAEAIAG
jgi:pimeloyl-ACP methyl ester carboxylesterase